MWVTVGNLEDLVGERLMFGLSGPRLTDADIRLFRDTRAAGLILYRRNFETPEQHSRLLHDLESALGRRLLVATEHEGGRIVRRGLSARASSRRASYAGSEWT
jgi:beta-N-acetylhexosaminidase